MTILDRLIKQSKDPKGFVGITMIRIMNLVHNERTKWALNELGIRNDSAVLDVGCGGGNTIYLLSKISFNGKICGIDYSQESVEITTKKNKKAVEKGLVEVVQSSVSNIPCSEETFDFVTAIQTHYYWTDLKNDIKEVFRVLKKEGSFMIASELYKIKYHMDQYKSSEEMRSLFEEIGFYDIKIVENNGWISIIGSKPCC